MAEPAVPAPPDLWDCPPERMREALSRLRPGALWRAFLPGADPAAALGLLGEGGPATLAAALRHVPGQDAILRTCGYPFAVPPVATLAQALLDDAARPAPPPAAGRLDHGPRERWSALVGECLDHAAAMVLAGGPIDTLEVFLSCSSGDLRPRVGLADADARDRFAAGLAAADGDAASFSRGYFRASAAAGLMQAVRASLEDVPGGTTGRDETGWPVWWEPGADGAPPDADRDRTGVLPAEPGAPRGHALAAAPVQAASLVRDWPEGLWLVAMRGIDGTDRWEAATAERLPDVLSGFPAWPPVDGLDVARVDAREEARLLGRIAAEAGIGAAAAERILAEFPPAKETSAEDVDW